MKHYSPPKAAFEKLSVKDNILDFLTISDTFVNGADPKSEVDFGEYFG